MLAIFDSARGLLARFCVAVLALALALSAHAAPGDLDPTFGSGGKVSTAIGSGHDDANAMVLQPDGKIVAGGWTVSGANYLFGLARYNSNGTLDASFGSGGIVTTAFGGTRDPCYAIVLQSDGKIVAAGYSARSDGG